MSPAVFIGRGAFSLALLVVVGCAHQVPRASAPAAIDYSAHFDEPVATPEDAGVDSRNLLQLTDWIAAHRELAIYSVVISHDGRVVYELYTSGLDRDAAHYMMSVTKSFLSVLVGIAIDRGLLRGPDQAVTDVLPRALFATEADRDRFSSLTLRTVLGMGALDAPDPPRDNSPAAADRHRAFWNAHNRAAFVTTLPRLTREPFQYNDMTPTLAAAMLTYATHRTVLESADEWLFGPLGFSHHEWMHEDPAGLDLGGYGLRVRPIDLQKLGVLMMNRGVWKGRAIVSRAWVERSFQPWQRSIPSLPEPNYGWYWWTERFDNGWTALVANGWKGQRLAILPAQRLVITLTGVLNDDDANALVAAIATKILASALRSAKLPHESVAAALRDRLEAVRTAPSRIAPDLETRMVPSAEPKETHHALR